MTNQQFSLAENFWNEASFEGKEFTKVDQNAIVSNPGHHWPEQTLIEWSIHVKEEDFLPFIEKFKLWKQECEELLLALNNQPSLKLLSSVESLIQQGLEEKMIGDIHPQMVFLEQGRQELNQIHQIQLIDLEQILQHLDSLVQNKDWTQETLSEANEIMKAWEAKTNYFHIQLKPYIQRWKTLKAEFNRLKTAYLDDKSIEYMHNMDLKMEICEEAEAIKDSKDWKKTSTEMEKFLARWKEIGQTPSHEKNEELWNRFRAARNEFFENRQAFFDVQKIEEEKNLALKLALVEQAETLTGGPWKKNEDNHQEILNNWKKIGKVPYDQVEALWNRLQKARDAFYEAKRENARAFRKTLDDNFEIKSALTAQAESLQHSEKWREVTAEMNELMDKWKATGRISREHGDELWDRFIKARRTFFDRKDAHREEIRKIQNEREEQRKEFLEKDCEDLELHIQDEKDKLKEFAESVARITGDNPKDDELKAHLKQLIQKIENELPKKLKKLEDMKSKLS